MTEPQSSEKVVKEAPSSTPTSSSTAAIVDNCRVKRKEGIGGVGTVRSVRQETRPAASQPKDKGLLVVVAWDNGTISHMSPEALELAAS